MKMTFFYRALPLFFALVTARITRDAVITKEFEYGNLYEVRDIEIRSRKASKPRRRITRPALPKWRELKFVAVGNGVELRVELNLTRHEVWARKPRSELSKIREPLDRSYRGDGLMWMCENEECSQHGDIHKSSVTFFESFGEQVFHAKIRLADEEWTVDPTHLVEKWKHRNGHEIVPEEALEQIDSSMFMFCSSEAFDSVERRHWNETIDIGAKAYMERRRRLQAANYEVYQNCFRGQFDATQVITIGMLIDDGFYIQVGNTAAAIEAYVESMFSDMNTMYSGQMGVEIQPGDVVYDRTIAGWSTQTFNTRPTTPGTRTCVDGRDFSDRLTALRMWRLTFQPSSHGLWHLMTHCHPSPGTVGVAYLRALCWDAIGVGLSNWLGASTWEVLAHEIGHNFGSGHTFDKGLVGGIMDYGDGLLNGIYQFHPVHRDEVCAEISSAMAQLRSVPACFTAQAVAPSPTLDDIYQWESTGVQGNCSVTCGSGQSQEIITCNLVELDSCTTTPPADADGCDTTNFAALGCTVTPANSSLCTGSCKPTPVVQNCNTGIPCSETCGDGVWEADEYCDPGIDSCCNQQCTGWLTTAACRNTNPIADAVVMDYDGRLWVFQGAMFSIFESMEAGTRLPGFPKPLTLFNGLSAFFINGLDSAVSFYDDYALFFKRERFVIVDLRELAQVGDFVYSIELSFKLKDANGCSDGVDAVISTYWTFDFICGDLVSEFRWDVGTADPQLVSAKWPGIGWAAGLNTGVGAAIREPSTGRIRMWKGNQIADVYPNGVVVVSQAYALGALAANTCNVENCASCSTDGTTCNVCNGGYSRKARGRVCRSNKYIVDLSFEDSDYTSTFYQYAYGGEWAAADNGGWNIDATIVDGAFEDGIYLDGKTEIRLQPVSFAGEDTIQDWKLSFWWYPDKLDNVKLLTLNRQQQYPDSSLTYTESFVISLVVNSTTEPIQNTRFAIELDMYGKFLDCYVDHPIQINFWNKISIEFREGEIITSANGQWHTIAMDGVKETDDLSVNFHDWTLGDSENGISGIIDAFQVYRPNSDASPSKSMPVYVVVIIVIVVLLVIFILWYFVYPRVCKRESKAKKAEVFRSLEFSSQGQDKPVPSGGPPAAPSIAPPSTNYGSQQPMSKRPPRPNMFTPSQPKSAPPQPMRTPPRPMKTPPKPSGVPPVPAGAAPPIPSGLPPPKPTSAPPKPNSTAPKKSKAPPKYRNSGSGKRPIVRTSGTRPPPRPSNQAPGSRSSGAAFDLGQTAQERRASWQV